MAGAVSVGAVSAGQRAGQGGSRRLKSSSSFSHQQMGALSNIFKRNSVYVSTIFVGAFAFGIGFDTVMTKFWEVRRISHPDLLASIENKSGGDG